MLSETNRTVEFNGNMKIVDGRVYTFAGSWKDLGEANAEERAFAARDFWLRVLSAEDQERHDRAAEYRAEMLRYGGLPWQSVDVYGDDGERLDGDARLRALREYRDTGAMLGAWLAKPGETPEERDAAANKGPASSEINWYGL